jgi:hypothetical protein
MPGKKITTFATYATLLSKKIQGYHDPQSSVVCSPLPSLTLLKRSGVDLVAPINSTLNSLDMKKRAI